MNLQQFLEEEKKIWTEKNNDLRDANYPCLYYPETEEIFLDEIIKHDTRLINFVLGKAKESVEKEYYDNEEIYQYEPNFNKLVSVIDHLKIK